MPRFLTRAVPVCLILLFLVPAVPGAQETEESPTADLMLFYGSKYLKKADWAPADLHHEFGVQFSYKKSPAWPVHVAMDLIASVDADDANSASTLELGLGARRIFGVTQRRFRPFIGAGGSLVRASREAAGYRLYSNGFGGWGDVGFYLSLFPGTQLGMDWRYSLNKVSLEETGSTIEPVNNSGGTHANILVGFKW